MNKKTLALVALSIPALTAAAITKKNSDLDLNYSIGGHTIDGNIDTGRILSTKLGLDFEHRYNPYLRFNFEGGVTLQTGTYERNAAAGDGPKPSNYLSLKESTVTLVPLSAFELKVGAINQKELDSPLLLTSTAFLAAKEQFTLGKESYGIRFFAEQAYAKNKDLASTLPDSEEGLPKFFAEGAKIYLKNETLNFDAHLMHWAYDNLGAGIATQSVALGNSPIGSVSGFTGFKYKFIGWYSGINLDVNLFDDHKLYLRGDYVINDKAPDGKKLGYSILGGFGINHGQGHLNIKGYYMDIESDAAPAYYARFQNNKTSFGGLIQWIDEKEPFKASIEAAHYEEKNNGPYQSPENRVWFSISSTHNIL